MALQFFIFVYWLFLMIVVVALFWFAPKAKSLKRRILGIGLALSIFPLHMFSEGGPHIVYLRMLYEPGNIVQVIPEKNLVYIVTELSMNAMQQGKGKQRLRLEIYDAALNKSVERRWLGKTGQGLAELSSLLPKVENANLQEKLKQQGYELKTLEENSEGMTIARLQSTSSQALAPSSSLKDFVNPKLLEVNDGQLLIAHAPNKENKESLWLTFIQRPKQNVLWQWKLDSIQLLKDEKLIQQIFLPSLDQSLIVSNQRLLFIENREGKLIGEYDQ